MGWFPPTEGSLLSFVYKFGRVACRWCYLLSDVILDQLPCPPEWSCFVYILEELTYLSTNIASLKNTFLYIKPIFVVIWLQKHYKLQYILSGALYKLWK